MQAFGPWENLSAAWPQQKWRGFALLIENLPTFETCRLLTKRNFKIGIFPNRNFPNLQISKWAERACRRTDGQKSGLPGPECPDPSLLSYLVPLCDTIRISVQTPDQPLAIWRSPHVMFAPQICLINAEGKRGAARPIFGIL